MKGCKMTNKYEHISPLDAWIDQMGLQNFTENELKTHLRVYGITEDADDLIRLIMISLRQEITECYERGVAAGKEASKYGVIDNHSCKSAANKQPCCGLGGCGNVGDDGFHYGS